MNQDPIQSLLQELATERRNEMPSAAVEAALLEAVRGNARRRRTRAVFASLAAAAAMALAVWLGFDRKATPEPERAVAAEAEHVPVVTEFVPLDYGLTDPGELTAGRLTRVTMPPTAPRDFGFPIPPHTVPGGVQADLLLSEDGTPQAVRFVIPSR